ncbi:MAG: T9SS type A sorting domain-containing protein [candidate division WOR-3 bacterium]|nr:MAG: T9SS type A sorting domain-containing protein [candidate division WOR-3 bacterium]
MKALLVLCICYAYIFARTTVSVGDVVYNRVFNRGYSEDICSDRVIIAQLGDVRSVLGSQGKSIAVSGGGEAVAVFYGMPSGDPSNSMLAKVAYSLNGGSSWTTYGPFTGASRRIYNDIAATPDFDANPGELFFCFQENTLGYTDGQINVMMEENLPSAPSFSVPIVPTNASAPAIYPWEPSIVVAIDDPTYLVATAWSYLVNGNEWAYCWISTDGGYSWTDTIPMAYINAGGAPGAISAGTGGHIFYAYVDYYTFNGSDSTPYPHYMESTDGGYTWSAETPISVFPANTSSQYMWHEFDCLVMDNEPWVVFNDIGIGGTGGPHVAKATGSPGNWTWTMWDAGAIGFDSIWRGDTLFYVRPGGQPSLSYEPSIGAVLVSYKAYMYVGNTLTWAAYDGPHIHGICSYDGGSYWISGIYLFPLSAPNAGEIAWDDWKATETADLLGANGNHPYVYSIWVHSDTSCVLYFEQGMVYWWDPGVEEAGNSSITDLEFRITPSIVMNACRMTFNVRAAADISLRVYDVSGRLVDDVYSGPVHKGTHRIDLHTDRLTNGTYFAVLQTESGQQVEKFIVVR